MNNPATPETRDFAIRLLADEAAAAAATPAEASVPVAFRVCEKLRRPLTILAGSAGSRSLLLRALTLAKQEAQSLGAVRVNADGLLEAGDAGLDLDHKDAKEGVVLVTHLLGLLFTFIGKTLTLRLMDDVWPDASFSSKGSSIRANTLTAEGTERHESHG